LPPALAAKLMERQNQLEPCVARLKRAIEKPEQVNEVIHELRAYQKELQAKLDNEPLRPVGKNNRLTVREADFDAETRERVIRVIEFFCPYKAKSVGWSRWVQYHQLSAGIVDNVPELVVGETVGLLLKSTRKSDMVDLWKKHGSALFTFDQEDGVVLRKRALLTFCLEELEATEEIMEKERERREALVMLEEKKIRKTDEGKRLLKEKKRRQTAKKRREENWQRRLLEEEERAEAEAIGVKYDDERAEEEKEEEDESEEIMLGTASPKKTRGSRRTNEGEEHDDGEGEDQVEQEDEDEEDAEEEEEEEEVKPAKRGCGRPPGRRSATNRSKATKTPSTRRTVSSSLPSKATAKPGRKPGRKTKEREPSPKRGSRLAGSKRTAADRGSPSPKRKRTRASASQDSGTKSSSPSPSPKQRRATRARGGSTKKPASPAARKTRGRR